MIIVFSRARVNPHFAWFETCNHVFSPRLPSSGGAREVREGRDGDGEVEGVGEG